MWELDCEESWVPKHWCFWNVVLEKTLESALDCKEIQPVHPKGDQSWVFGRNDAIAETPVLWTHWKRLWCWRDWGQEEKGTTKDEMAGWHHWLDGHEFGWALGVGDGQGGPACCDSWGCKESDTTEQLNWTYTLHDIKHLWLLPFHDCDHKCSHTFTKCSCRGWYHHCWKQVSLVPFWEIAQGQGNAASSTRSQTVSPPPFCS